MIYISYDDPKLTSILTVSVGDIWIVDYSNIKTSTPSTPSTHYYPHQTILVYQAVNGGYNWGIFFTGTQFNVTKTFYAGKINIHPEVYDSSVTHISTILAPYNSKYPNSGDLVTAFDAATNVLYVYELGKMLDRKFPLNLASTTPYTPWNTMTAVNGAASVPTSPNSSPAGIGGIPMGVSASTARPSKLYQTNSLISLYDVVGNLLVDIDTMGNIIYGPTYTPTAAAQHFWSAISGNSPVVLNNQISALQLQLAQLTLMSKGTNIQNTSLGSNTMANSTGAQDTDDSSYQRAMKILG